MSTKNKCAEFGIYLLSIWSVFSIVCLTVFLINKIFNIGSLDFVDSFIAISMYLGSMVSALTLLIGLASLSYKPKKLAAFLLLSSLILFTKNSSDILIGIVS